MLRVRACLAPLLLAACATPVTPAAPAPAAPAPTAPAPSGAKVDAPAPSYAMRGKLLGHDGKPMKLAHVHLGEPPTPVDAGGGLLVTAPGPGFLPVRFTGVDHADLTVGLYFDGRPADVEITLGTYARRVPPFARASVVVYLPPAGGGPPAPRGFPQPVQRLANDRYGLVLLEKTDPIFYALDGVARFHRVNGVGDGFAWDGHGSYITELHRRDGAFHIVLDAGQMPPDALRPRLRFADPESRAARITNLRFDAALRAEDDGARPSPDPAWRTEIARALASERDAEIAAALRIAYLAPPSGLDARAAEAVAVARDLLDGLPADAPLWALAPAAAITAVDLVGRTPEREAYLDRVGEGLRDRDTAAAFVGARLRGASRAGRDAEAARLFEIMRARFPDTAAARAVAFYSPARRVRPDHEAPDFDLPAMADGALTPPGTRLTRAGLRGKVVLFDFWGFWCIPCIAEMGTLHDVFDRHKDEGFTIVSVAVHTKLPAIRNFRASRWPMPWRHVLLDERNLEDTLARFEVKSYPSPILIDRAGKIVAAGDDLRGEALDRVVAAALAAGVPAP